MRKRKKKTKNASNALVHGVYASEMLLPWESSVDLNDLYHRIRAELQPASPLEDEVILDVTRLHWLKRRLMRSAQIEFHREPYAAELAETGKKGWLSIQKYFDRQRSSEKTLIGSTRTMIINLNNKISDVTIAAANDAKQAEQLEKLAESLSEFQQRLLPLLKCVEEAPNEENTFERAYNPADMERIVKIEAMIDVRIEKALARLNLVREMRRMHRVTTTGVGQSIDMIQQQPGKWQPSSSDEETA